MAEIQRGPTVTSTAITHYGEWNDTSRSVPALAFFEKYDAVVTSCDFSGPYHDWFAPSAKFYINNGTTLNSGEEIWEWMKSPNLFGGFERLEARNRVTSVILGGGEGGGDRLVHQQDMVFFPKEGRGKGEGISVRRCIEFVSGNSEVEGQGTDGLQYFVGRTFWDSAVLSDGLKGRSVV